MRLDDNSPVEFIFGKIPQTQESRFLQLSQPYNSSRLELELWVSGFIYGLTALVVIQLFRPFQLSIESLVIFAFLGIASAVISTWKHVIQLRRYGPDIRSHQYFSSQFMVIQAIVAYLVSGIFLLMGYFTLTNLSFINPIASYVVLGMIGFIMYARVVSNISLTSAGLGIGLLSSLGGIKNMAHNFTLLNQVNGKNEYHLASLRIFFWMILITTYHITYGIIFQVISVLLFSIAYERFEKRNGSSIMMQIRGIIQKMSPTSLPSIDFDDNATFIMEPPQTAMKSLPKRTRVIRRSNAKYGDEIPTPTREDLTPIAARSMNRIASSILSEEELSYDSP